MERMNADIRRELVKSGLSADYLQPVYRCPLCKDTGYVGEPVHEQCVCLKRAVLNRLYDNDGLQGLKTQNFETFDENIFPDTFRSRAKSRAHSEPISAKFRQILRTTMPMQFEAGKRERDVLLYGRVGLGQDVSAQLHRPARAGTRIFGGGDFGLQADGDAARAICSTATATEQVQDISDLRPVGD